MKSNGKFAALIALGFAVSAVAHATDVDDLNRALRQEAVHGRIGRLRELIHRGAEVNGKADYGETALYYAIMFGRVKAALQLIRWGADPNAATDELDRTPLLKAAEDCDFRVVDALLRAGAEINHADYFGRTALINASEYGCVRAVAVILDHHHGRGRGKVDIMAQDGGFQTAADYARHPRIVKMLQDAQAPEADGKATPVLP